MQGTMSLVKRVFQPQVNSLPCGVTKCHSAKLFPDFMEEAHWDCTGEFLLKIRNWFIRFIFVLIMSN